MAWGIPVSDLEGMSADELHDYMAYFSVEPWGCPADDVRTAIVAHTVASCFTSKPPEFREFLPTWEPPKPVSYREGAEMFEAILRAV